MHEDIKYVYQAMRSVQCLSIRLTLPFPKRLMQSLDIIQSPPVQPIFDTQRLIMALNQNTHALRGLEDGVRILDINVQPDIPWHNAGVDAYVSLF